MLSYQYQTIKESFNLLNFYKNRPLSKMLWTYLLKNVIHWKKSIQNFTWALKSCQCFANFPIAFSSILYFSWTYVEASFGDNLAEVVCDNISAEYKKYLGEPWGTLTLLH